MAAFSKDNPDCQSEILFIGTTVLRPLNDPAHPLATAQLSLEVIGPRAYQTVDFEDLMLFLEIKDPTPSGVEFVEHPSTNYRWGTPQGSGWVEATASPFPPTTRLRGRKPTDRVYSSPGNGATYWVGVHGLQDTDALYFSAFATAKRTLASTNGCSIQMKDFHLGDVLRGMMG